MLSILQTDIDTYNERIGTIIGGIIDDVLLMVAIVWLIKRSRKGFTKDVRVAADSRSHTPSSGGRSGDRARTHPLMAWFITLVLVIANSSLGYVVAQRVEAAEVRGVVSRTVGGLIAWPLVLLIVYALSRKFRDRYSIHEVINYGLGLNTIIQAIPIFGRLVVLLKQS
jgi:hypothetical protein